MFKSETDSQFSFFLLVFGTQVILAKVINELGHAFGDISTLYQAKLL